MHPEQKSRILREAGFVPCPRGWVKQAFAERVQDQIDAYEAEQAAALAKPPKPRGRPKKEIKK